MVLRLHGEHDASTAATLCGLIAEALARSEGDVTIDLTDVSFLSAATVSVLTRARAMLSERGRALELVAPTRPAARVLAVCGVALAPPPPGL